MEKLIPICENREYRRIYTRGKSIVTPQLVIYYGKNRLDTLRVGITTGKKIGNAVKRNRARRVIREAARQTAPYVRRGYDLVLVARGKTPYLKSTEITEVLFEQLGRAGLLQQQRSPKAPGQEKRP